MKIFDFVRKLESRNTLLFRVGLLHALAFMIFLALFIADDRMVLNINVWIKPMKFALTIFIYLWTFAWLLYYLPSRRSEKIISIVIAVSMLVEMTIIAFQAARGEQSHFNVTSALNGILFSIMGAFIGINTFANVVTLVLFFSKEVRLSPSFRIAWRAGLFLFVAGSISGGWMVARLSHTIGAADGGAGLPFVNWSTVAGDIRAAHFFTLHGLQLIPLLWWLISVKFQFTSKTWVLVVICVVYTLCCVLLHLLAYQGQPLIHQ